MYFAHFTVSGVSAPLLCDSVFASCCGKHNIAMIAHAFQKAQNTAETFILSLPLSLNLFPLSPSASVSPLPHFQPRYSAPMIANTHNDSISWGPAEVPHWCWETLSCRHIAGNLLAVHTGAWWALARHRQKLGWLFFVNKMKCKLCRARMHWNSSLLPPITRPGWAPWKHKREYIIK